MMGKDLEQATVFRTAPCFTGFSAVAGGDQGSVVIVAPDLKTLRRVWASMVPGVPLDAAGVTEVVLTSMEQGSYS